MAVVWSVGMGWGEDDLMRLFLKNCMWGCQFWKKDEGKDVPCFVREREDEPASMEREKRKGRA